MGEYQAFEYSNWLQHTVTLTEMTVYEYRDYLNEANKKIIEAKALVGEIEELEAIEYEDMTSILEKGMLDLENIRKYGVDSGLYWRVREADRKLYEKLQKKVVEKFSLIKIEDIKVPNNKGLEIVTVGLKEGSPHISKREKKELTLADFASSIKKEEVTYMDGFAEVIFGEQASIETQKEVLENVKNAGGIDQTKVSEEQLAEMELGTYLMKNAEQFQNMRSSDEIDHKTCSQAVMFASEMLDILIVPAVVKAITGYDYITGEQLSGFERGVKGVQAAVETIAIGAAIAKGLGGVGVACVVGEEGAEEVTGRGIGVLCETAGLSPEASLLINVGLVAAGMGSAKKVKKIEEIVEESSDASKHLDDIVDSSIKKVDDAYQTSKSISKVDKIKIDGWKYRPDDATYLKYKNIYDNPKYYNQKTGSINYPGMNGDKNIDGFLNGVSKPDIIEKGKVINRYGDNGNAQYFSPKGTSLSQRALPPGTENKAIVEIKVLKNIPCSSGKIASWFDQPGGGIQYYTDVQIKALDGSMVDATMENLEANLYIRIKVISK